MNDQFRNQIKQIAAWFTSLPHNPSPETELLTNSIYHRFYCLQSPTIDFPETNLQAGFTEALSAANTTREDIDLHWIVEQRLASGHIRASKASHSIFLQPFEYIPVEGVNNLEPGSRIARIYHKERKDIQPVFYYAFSNTIFNTETPLMRLYWNIRPDFVARLLHKASELFNYYRLPYLFKCLNDPQYYKRRDSAVLYVAKQFISLVNELIPEVHMHVGPGMVDDIPMLTHRIARGLGYADDPNTGQSFGIHRCGLIATGLVAGIEKKQSMSDDFENEILCQFELAGIDPDRPYLNRGSKQAITSF